MSNVQISDRGGNPVPSTTLVAVDNTTIDGDGSGQRPLRVIGSAPGGGQTYQAASGSAPGVVKVGMAVSQSGIGVVPTTAVGLQAVSGIALVGNPGGSPVTVQVDGLVTLTVAQWDAIITGAGSGLTKGATYYVDPANDGFLTTTQPGAPGDAVTVVGVAISTTELQLQQGEPLPVDGSSARPYISTMNSGSTLIGGPLFASGNDLVGPGAANSLLGAACVGLALAAAAAHVAVRVQATGFFTLTHAQWDAVAGTVGGLVAGDPYYIGAADNLTHVQPASPNFVAQVGIAIDSTTMLLQLSPPIPGV